MSKLLRSAQTQRCPALLVGLLGGTIYVQSFMTIDRELPPNLRELALSTASVGDTSGILLANVTGLFIQWCLFASLGLHGAHDTIAEVAHKCPLPVWVNDTRPP